MVVRCGVGIGVWGGRFAFWQGRVGVCIGCVGVWVVKCVVIVCVGDRVVWKRVGCVCGGGGVSCGGRVWLGTGCRVGLGSGVGVGVLPVCG